MKRNCLAVAALMIALVFAMTAQAQERPPESGPPVFLPQPGQPVGTGRAMPPIREYSQRLRERAREAQELADRLRREADELDGMAGPGQMPRMGPGPADPAQQELAELREAIGRAEREGQHEKAMDLRNREEQLRDKIRAREQGPQGDERELREMKMRIQALQDKAREAQEAGRGDEAQGLREESKDVQVKLDVERQIREMVARIEPMRDKVADLRRQAEQAKRDGRADEAQAQWAKADEVERQIGEAKGKIERFKIESQLKFIRTMIDRARQRGDSGEAEALTREAGELKQRLQDLGPGQELQARDGDLPRTVDELRQEVKRLRQEMEELKKQIRDRESR